MVRLAKRNARQWCKQKELLLFSVPYVLLMTVFVNLQQRIPYYWIVPFPVQQIVLSIIQCALFYGWFMGLVNQNYKKDQFWYSFRHIGAVLNVYVWGKLPIDLLSMVGYLVRAVYSNDEVGYLPAINLSAFEWGALILYLLVRCYLLLRYLLIMCYAVQFHPTMRQMYTHITGAIERFIPFCMLLLSFLPWLVVAVIPIICYCYFTMSFSLDMFLWALPPLMTGLGFYIQPYFYLSFCAMLRK